MRLYSLRTLLRKFRDVAVSFMDNIFLGRNDVEMKNDTIAY